MMAEHAVEHGGHGGGHGEAAGHHVNYWAIFGILCLLTAVSALADVLGSDKESASHGDSHAVAAEHAAPAARSDRMTGKKLAVILVVMAVAIAKATFVIMYFMHVKFEGRWIYAMLLPTTVLACAIPAALLPDVGLHYYTVQTPQSEEYFHGTPEPAHTAAEHHEAPAHDDHKADSHKEDGHKDAGHTEKGEAHPDAKAHK